MKLNEFKVTPDNGNNDYLHTLASAWYNGTYNTSGLDKSIKTQQDIEKILSHGVICQIGRAHV